MTKHIISTENAPKAIGPYSQAVRSGDLLFLSGQIPIDPTTGQIVGHDAATQTRQVLENLRAVLWAAGADFQDVVRATIYLTDMNDFAQVNEVYAEYFSTDPPARATVAVLALPRGALVEIEVMARKDK